MIRCQCSHCGYEIKTYDKFAGKRVRCPKCKEAVQIPEGEGGVSPKPAAVIKFRCPNCNQKIGLPLSYGGKVVRCAKCKHRLRVPQAPGAAAQVKPQDEVAALKAGHEQPSADGSTIPGLGDMSDLLQLEASAPSLEEPLRLSPAEDTSEGGAAAAYARQFPTRPSFQADVGEEKKKSKLVVPIVIAAVFIAALVIGYMSVKSFTSSLDTTESQAGVDFDEARQFTEDYITLLAGGDIEAAMEKLSPEVKAITSKAQIERLVKLVGENDIVTLEVISTYYEEDFAGDQYYLWYKLSYEEGEQFFLASIRQNRTGFKVDGIAAEGTLGRTVVIGQSSYDQLMGMAIRPKVATFLARITRVLIVVFIIVIVIQVISMWVLFDKAGQPGWAAIIPFYNVYVLADVGDQSTWVASGACFGGIIPIIGPIIEIACWIMISVGVAKSFDHGVLFGIGLTFLPFIFYPILAFSRD